MKKNETYISKEENTSRSVAIVMLIVFCIALFMTTCTVRKKLNQIKINNIENNK